eukprot:CFRG5752T1
MSKAFKGVLVTCDAAMKEYLIWVNETESTRFIIDADLDETHILIDPAREEYVRKKVDDLMDALSFSPLEQAEKEAEREKNGR